jgi:DTW domain-containing protein YfiP
MPVVSTSVEFLVVRHVREARKPSNTARLAAAAIPRCRILDYGAPDQPFDDAPLRRDAWLLFPPELDGNGVETGRHPIVAEGSAPLPEAIVVLDGTWGQARRMSHRIPALDRMPRVALAAPVQPPARLRQAATPEGMPTIEAMARLLERFEESSQAQLLHALHNEFVRRTRTERGVVGEWTSD